MTNTILVTYASRTGSTAEIAQYIGKTLSDLGEKVDVISMNEVTDISKYDFVVAGSAIQAGKWLPEAADFIETNKIELNQKSFAVFLVCMTLAMKKADSYRGFVSGWLDPVRNIVKPKSEGLFKGSLDINKIPSLGDRIKFRISILFGVWKEGDHRDWQEIKDWATNLRTLSLQVSESL
jgi:menaquinone-dependent protoporphyrinogen oxidase